MYNGIHQRINIAVSKKYYEDNGRNFKIKGTLLDKKDNIVKIGISEDKMLTAELKEPIGAEVGDTVVIDKKNIIQSKVGDIPQGTAKEEIVKQQEEEVKILKKMDLPVNEETKEAVRVLKDHGVKISKGNIQGFIASKNHLDSVIQGLDYDTAVKLIEKNIDIEGESLQKIADGIQQVKEEKEGFSLFKLFSRKKKITTEDAEKIAKNLYGSRMGKDITDSIKALHKAGMDVTRKNIHRINDILRKVDNLQGIKDETIVDTVKNKIDATVDYLYKLKNAVVKGTISPQEDIGRAATSRYEATSYIPPRITEKDLVQMEEDIKELLEKSEMKVTEENIKLAKTFIKTGVELTTENIQRVQDIKEAIVELKKTLDHEKAAILLQQGVEVEKQDIVELARQVQKMEGGGQDLLKEKTIVSREDIIDRLQDLESLDDKKLVHLLKEEKDMNLKTLLKAEDLSDSYRKEHPTLMKHNITLGLQRLEMLEKLQQVETNTIAFQMKNRFPMTIKVLELSQQFLKKEIAEDTLKAELKTPLPVEIPKKLPMGTELLMKRPIREINNQLGNILEEGRIKEMARALLENNISLNKANMQNLFKAERFIGKITEGLTEGFIEKMQEKNLPLEELPLKELAELMEKETEATRKDKIDTEKEVRSEMVEKVKGLVKSIEGISYGQKGSILSLLFKNAMPITLKETQGLSFFLNNQQQIGSEMKEMLEILERTPREEIKHIATAMRGVLEGISGELKSGKLHHNRPYEEFTKLIKELEGHSSILDEGTKDAIQKSGSRLLHALEIQMQLNKEDTLLQLPVMMGDEFKNLQIYVMKDKKGSKKIDPRDMSVLLNFDTNNMGNVNVYVGVNYKKVVMKMGLNRHEDQVFMEGYIKQMEGMLEEMGYELKDFSFRVAEEQHILSLTEEMDDLKEKNNTMLDVKI